MEAGRARDTNNTRQAEEQGREPPTSPPPPPVGRRKAPQNGAAPPPNVDRRETTRQHCTAPARTATASFPPRPPTSRGGNRRARPHTAGIDGSRRDGGCRGHAQSQSSGASCYGRVVASRVAGRTHAPAPQTVCLRALTGPPRGKEAAGARHPPSAPLSARLFFRPLPSILTSKSTRVLPAGHMLPGTSAAGGWGAPLDFPP